MFIPPLLQSLCKLSPAHHPVWFMRQAGRSLPEYKAVRGNTGMLESCLIPEMAAEITLQPVRRHKVDGAVFFSDIMVPLKLAGVGVEIQSGIGPVLDRPVQHTRDLDVLLTHQLNDGHSVPLTSGSATQVSLETVTQAVKIVADELTNTDGTYTPVLAFAGAPFTLAAYLVEGKPSKDHLAARGLMHSDPQVWHRLMQWCADISIAFLEAQIAGGASAFQLFDSWAGSLRRADYVNHVMPYSMQVLAHAHKLGVPRIHFGVGTNEILPEIWGAGTDCVGVDWRLDIPEALHRITSRLPGYATDLVDPAAMVTELPAAQDLVVQGNLDTALLTAPVPVIETAIQTILTQGKAAGGHIFNLGHGVPPTTDPGVLTHIVEFVHSQS